MKNKSHKNKKYCCKNCKEFIIREKDGAIICTFIGILLKSPYSYCDFFEPKE